MSQDAVTATMASTTSPESYDQQSQQPVTTASPTSYARDSSPSPSLSPTPALLACPSLDRSFSTNSSTASSDYSRLSIGSRSSSGSATAAAAAARRRGYVRPQGATFAASAKNRDSVMSLGSIAHVQYYFARTGILDGKGAQLAREDPTKSKNKRSSQQGQSQDGTAVLDASQFLDVSSPTTPTPTVLTDETATSPGLTATASTNGDVEAYEDDEGEWEDQFMLPPTVSTYNHRNQYVPPPPDVGVLRDELRSALADLVKALDDLKRSEDEQRRMMPETSSISLPQAPSDYDADLSDGQRSPARGWHEIQGTHILDVATLAIKAAREYYLMHDRRELLAKVKSERQIREELLGVMDMLARLAQRDFAGGVREDEAMAVRAWVRTVEDFLVRERAVEEQERRDRDSWTWLDDARWAGRPEREREREFMRTFAIEGEELPLWEELRPDAEPTPFLRALANGLLLCRLHNRVLAKSRRQYARIDAPHTDFAVPYRAAENLRYWLKAAEIRWEIKLQMDVMDVVYDRGPAAWVAFDDTVLRWCRAVREEITREWRTGAVTVEVPELRYD